MENIYRDIHLLLDTLDIQLTKLGKNVVDISKLFILEALKQGCLLPITKNYFNESPTPPPNPHINYFLHVIMVQIL